MLQIFVSVAGRVVKVLTLTCYLVQKISFHPKQRSGGTMQKATPVSKQLRKRGIQETVRWRVVSVTEVNGLCSPTKPIVSDFDSSHILLLQIAVLMLNCVHSRGSFLTFIIMLPLTKDLNIGTSINNFDKFHQKYARFKVATLNNYSYIGIKKIVGQSQIHPIRLLECFRTKGQHNPVAVHLALR